MQSSEVIKSCCAVLYASDWVQLLLENTFHPGGLPLTQRLGELLKLEPDHHVLDVAAGQGKSAVFLAEKFGCEVVGVDYSDHLVEEARRNARAAGVADQVTFQQADAEQLPFADAEFDAVICECAFCIFPDKQAAAHEFIRLLRPGGHYGMSDLTRSGELPRGIEGLLAWIACIAAAQPINVYCDLLETAGFALQVSEVHDDALAELIKAIRGKIVGIQVLSGLGELDLPAVEVEKASNLARAAACAVRDAKLGYVLLVGEKTLPC